MVKDSEGTISLYVKFLSLYFVLLLLGALGIGAFGSLLRYIGLLPALFGILQILQAKEIQLLGELKYVLLFTVWAMLSAIWSLDSSLSLGRAWSYFTFLLLVISATGQAYNDNEINFLKNALVWSSRITIVASLLFGSYSTGRLVFSGVISEDPNYLCGYYFFSLSNAIVVLCSEETVRKKVLAGIEIFLISYLIIATGSRGGALGAIACVLVVLIMLQVRDRGSLKATLRPIFIVAVVGVFGIILTSISSSSMLERFSAEAIVESNGTGRYDIWKGTIDAFSESNIFRKLCGYGSGAARLVGRLFGFSTNVTHNAFLQILIELGLVGLFFYAAHILKFAFYSFKTRDIFSFGVVVGMIVLSMSTSILTFKPYWNILIFITCLSCREEEVYVEKST